MPSGTKHPPHHHIKPIRGYEGIGYQGKCSNLCVLNSHHISPKPYLLTHTTSIAFRHLPPNSARISYATEGAHFISAQLSTDAVSALRKVWILIRSIQSKHASKHEARPPRVKERKEEFRLHSNDFGFVSASVSNVGSYKRIA